MTSPTLSIATWNIEWRPSASKDAALMRDRLFQCEPEIVCITEGYADFFNGEGYLISAGPDYGYPLIEGRRKVMLWSARPWGRTNTVGDRLLPSGRFAAGQTETSLGPINVMGVCIPWRDAHVRSGRRDRQPWDDHLAYLCGLQRMLSKVDGPTIVLGDFNQRVPLRYQPKAIYSALLECLGERFSVATEGPLPPVETLSIDHIAHTPELRPVNVSALSNVNASGRELSDHFGVTAHIARMDAPTGST